MKTAYILHGTCDKDEYYQADSPSPSNNHWLRWLQQKFLRSGVLAQSLEMPKPYAPCYEDWCKVWEQSTILNEETIIVTHSAGCGFILKWLSQNENIKLGNMYFVAPGRDLDQKYGNFLQCELDKNLDQRTGEIHILYSENESFKGVTKTKNILLELYTNARLHTFPDYKHFCYKHLKGEAFPELWDIINS